MRTCSILNRKKHYISEKLCKFNEEINKQISHIHISKKKEKRTDWVLKNRGGISKMN